MVSESVIRNKDTDSRHEENDIKYTDFRRKLRLKWPRRCE